MKNLLFTGILVVLCINLNGQIEVQAHLGTGFTGVDVESWYGGGVQDWGTLMGEAYATVYPFHKGGLSIGGEIGYQYFFWYTVPVFGYSWVYEYNVDAIRIMGLLRSKVGAFGFAEVGPGLFFISDWVSPGLMASLGYNLRLNENLKIPLKFRVEYVAGDGFIALGLSGGVSFTLKGPMR
jgi:hypothetical protein